MELSNHEDSLLNALSDIDPRYICEAQALPHKFTLHRLSVTVAAVFLLFVSTFVVYSIGSIGNAGEKTNSLTITAQALDGNTIVLQPNQSLNMQNTSDALISSYFNNNSYTDGYWNLPVFSFNVFPSGWTEHSDVQLFYDFEVCYQDKILTSSDEQICLAYNIRSPQIPHMTGYRISGRFPESTDLAIIIKQKSDGKLIDYLNVTITYLEESNNYQLTYNSSYSYTESL